MPELRTTPTSEIRALKDVPSGTTVYPATIARAVTLTDGRSVQDLVDENLTAIFPVTVSGSSPTTFAELEAAIAAGKVPMILTSEDVFQLMYYMPGDSAIFSSIYHAGVFLYDIDGSNDTWTSSNVTFGDESTSNKVTSISSSSTDTQYPSAKCVYDLVGDIETLLAAI